MASLHQRANGRFRISYYFGGRRFFASLKTKHEREATLTMHRLEENLQDVERGRLAIPEGADLSRFLLSDGRVITKPVLKKRISLKDLFDRYEKEVPEGIKESNTRKMEGIHMRRLLKELGSNLSTEKVTRELLQQYVKTRSGHQGSGGNGLSHVTIKKELSTLTGIWNKFALPLGIVAKELSTKGLLFNKRKPKPPFQTCPQIERQISRGGLSDSAIDELWDCLFLTLPEIEELLAFIETTIIPAIRVMYFVAAHTGARRSEMLRIRIDDVDIEGERIQLREKKKDRSKEETYRSIPLTPKLLQVLKDWVTNHPGGQMLIVDQKGKPLTLSQVSWNFRTVVQGSKWEVLPGWHVLRHSFASNCAARGIDQRIIDEWMGHQTEEMRRRYRHMIPSNEQRAIHLVFAGD